jgi:hypothetical protein
MGSAFPNNTEHFRQERKVIARASALPGSAVWLARKSACDQVGGDIVDIGDVAVVGDIGPVLGEDGVCIRVNFAEADGGEARPVRGEGEPANTAKESRCVGFMRWFLWAENPLAEADFRGNLFDVESRR